MREYPTIFGARAVARLLAYADDDEALLEAVRPLGKRAVNTLVGTLNDSVELHLEIDWLTHERPVRRGDAAARQRSKP